MTVNVIISSIYFKKQRWWDKFIEVFGMQSTQQTRKIYTNL